MTRLYHHHTVLFQTIITSMKFLPEVKGHEIAMVPPMSALVWESGEHSRLNQPTTILGNFIFFYKHT